MAPRHGDLIKTGVSAAIVKPPDLQDQWNVMEIICFVYDYVLLDKDGSDCLSASDAGVVTGAGLSLVRGCHECGDVTGAGLSRVPVEDGVPSGGWGWCCGSHPIMRSLTDLSVIPTTNIYRTTHKCPSCDITLTF